MLKLVLYTCDTCGSSHLVIATIDGVEYLYCVDCHRFYDMPDDMPEETKSLMVLIEGVYEFTSTEVKSLRELN
jgi:hypothetical protein